MLTKTIWIGLKDRFHDFSKHFIHTIRQFKADDICITIDKELAMEKDFKTRRITVIAKKSPGFCISCGAPATTEAMFPEPGAIIIQRYCDNCLPMAKRG